jgi:hypothetical protein
MLLIVLFLAVCMLTLRQGETFVMRGFRMRFSQRSEARVVVDSSTPSQPGDFTDSFVAQKNFILLEKFENPVNGNLTEAAEQYVNFCDESFDHFLSEKIASLPDEKSKQTYGKIRYAVNTARQKKLMEADAMLRGILAAGGAESGVVSIKPMEAKLQYHLRRSEIDMAFMVLLQLNIEDAIASNATMAVQVMTHLRTLINEHQDKMVTAPVRLLRLLVRENDTNVRKQMLRQKLLIGRNVAPSMLNPNQCADGDGGVVTGDACCSAPSSAVSENKAQPTTTPQCDQIVVQAVESWGGADVTVKELEDTITDVLAQVS